MRALYLLPSLFLLLGQQGAPILELVRPEEAMLAIFTLENQLRTEGVLLTGMETEYDANLIERARYTARLQRLYADLESGWVAPEETFDPARLRRGDDELAKLEKAQDLAWDEGRRLRREMLRARSRISLLRVQLSQLLASLPADAESLTGYWDVVLLGGGERGVFFLVQSGAVLSGEYGLQGGYRGSLQGTFIDRSIVLHRIDTRLGRVMDLDGSISADGKVIRGSWQRYDLSSGRPATGSWVANRRVSNPQDAGSP